MDNGPEMVTGDQGYVDGERSCYWTWDDTECVWQSRPFRRKEEEEREKENAKDDPKGPEEHCLVMNKRKILNGGKKKTQFGGPKEKQEGLVKRQ